SGQVDEARNRFELVRQSPAVPLLGLQASLRLAQIDFDLRQFDQSEAAVKSLLNQALPGDLSAAALVLGGEAAYWARDYDQSVAFYTRFLADLPGHPLAPKVGLALGWAEFRRGRLDIARERWTSFAREAPSDPRAGEALLLSAELAAKAGDVGAAQSLLGEVIAKPGSTEQGQVAILNRAILNIDAGRASDALSDLSAFIQRAPQSPYVGRARLARGIALVALGRTPAAQLDFQAALAQGEDVLAHLGLGVVAFGRSDWDAATREFTAAKDAGSGEAAAAGEYGVAAAAFNGGKTADFSRLATPLLSRPDDPRVTPPVLLGMAAVAAEEKRWSDARDLALRLADRFPQREVAPTALAELGAAAGQAQQWPLAREMYEALARRYPGHPGNAAGRVVFAEALLRTGAPADARRELEAFVQQTSPSDPRMPEALLVLAQAQEATGNRAAALDLYSRVQSQYPGYKEGGAVLLSTARLLQGEGKWEEARGQLERAMDQGDALIVTEAAYRLGEGLRAAGRNEDAVEAYMTAAYLGPDTNWARRALLGAGESFAALKQPDSAAIVYKKLLAMSGVEPELAAEARSRLKALGVN
ncbi:MAG TPA: tetratricopeptide repeat protein, partial [Candidatus Methylomirabilis sp.]|nr:tetratricopeptide repeat protein [Candidatus Methylomirabilis sp.]